MKAVIQRVLSASVFVDDKEISAIGEGVLILLGIERDDTQESLNYLTKKTIGLRIFNDDQNNMNLSLLDIGGAALVVSQFTLCADTQKGRRPSFINAAPSEKAERNYKKYCEKLQAENIAVQMGIFGSMMEVKLINDGPVTIILDSKDKM